MAPPASSTSAPSEQLVTVHTLAPQPRGSKVRYQGGKSRGLGGLLIIGGLVAVLLGALLLWACSLAGVAGAGMWGGLFVSRKLCSFVLYLFCFKITQCGEVCL